MKSIIIVYFPLESNIPLTHPYYGYENAEQKQEWLLDCFPKSVEIYMARWIQSYIGDNTFIPQYQKKAGIWVENTKPREAHLILWFQIPKSVTRIFNTMSSFTLDKTRFEKIFPQYAIPSVVCESYEEMQENFWNISSILKVLKPQFGTRSKGIFIQEKIPKFQDIWEDNYPYLLQEFHDTSQWFYSFPGLHDFRVVMLNGEIIWKFLRQPEIGKYTANSFKKWNFIDLETWELPDEIRKIINGIEAYCTPRFQHRYYSIDMGQWKNGEVKVFEVNSAPWLTNKKIAEKLWHYIIKNILKISENSLK